MGLILDFWGSHFDKLNDFLDSGGRNLENAMMTNTSCRENHMQHLPVCVIPKDRCCFGDPAVCLFKVGF